MSTGAENSSCDQASAQAKSLRDVLFPQEASADIKTLEKLYAYISDESFNFRKSIPDGTEMKRFHLLTGTDVDEKDAPNIKELLTSKDFGWNKSTILQFAVRCNNRLAVSEICEYYKVKDLLSYINEKNDVGNTALHIAAELGYAGIVEQLVQAGADLLAENNYRSIPLHVAIEANHRTVVKRLLDLAGDLLRVDPKEDPNKLVREGVRGLGNLKDVEKAFFWATKQQDGKPYYAVLKRKDPNVMNHLLPTDGALNIVDKLGTQPLYNERLKHLLAFHRKGKGKKFYVKLDKKGSNNGRHIVVNQYGYAEYEWAVRWEVKSRSKETSKDSKAVNQVDHYDEDMFKKELKKEPRDHAEVFCGGKSDGKPEYVTWHLESELSAMSEEFSEPVLTAINKAKQDIAADVLRRSSQANQNGNDELKISKIVKRRHPTGPDLPEYEVLWTDKELLPTKHTRDEIKKAQTTEPDRNGDALCEEFDAEADESIRHYLNYRNMYGKSPWITTCEFGKLEIATYILLHEAWKKDKYIDKELVCSGNGAKISVLMYAVGTGILAMVKLLVENGADVQSKAVFGDSAVHWGVEKKFDDSDEIVALLLDSVRNLEYRKFSDQQHREGVKDGTDDQTIDRINHSRKEKAQHAVMSLLNGRKNTEEVPDSTTNPLMRAASHGNLEIVKLLVENGADKYLQGRDIFASSRFKSAAEYALEKNYYDVALYLEPELTKSKLEAQFNKRCKASARFKYLNLGSQPEMWDTEDYGFYLQPPHDELWEIHDYVKEDKGEVVLLKLAKGDNEEGKDDKGPMMSDSDREKLNIVRNILTLNDYDPEVQQLEKNSVGGSAKVNITQLKLQMKLSTLSIELVAAHADAVSYDTYQKVTYSLVTDDSRVSSELNESQSGKSSKTGESGKSQGTTPGSSAIDIKQSSQRLDALKNIAQGALQGNDKTKLYLYSPRDRPGHHYIVQIIKVESSKSIAAKAFDYYMDRLAEFKHIGLVAATRGTVFLNLCDIVSHAKLRSLTLFQEVIVSIFEGFMQATDYDYGILWRIVKLIQALDKAATLNPRLKRPIDECIERFESVIESVFDARAMSQSENVLELLSNSVSPVVAKSIVFREASCFYDPVISTALDLGITSLFGIPQMSALTERVLNGNLFGEDEDTSDEPVKKDKEGNKCCGVDMMCCGQKGEENAQSSSAYNTKEVQSIFSKDYSPQDFCAALIEHRGTKGFRNVRYCPIVMFLLEGVSKAIYLAMITYVSIYEYGWLYSDKVDQGPADPRRDATLWYGGRYDTFKLAEIGILLWLIAYILSEAGGFMGNTMELGGNLNHGSFFIRRFINKFYENFFTNVWNFLDIVTIVFSGVWALCHQSEEYIHVGRAFLACAAIPAALSLLRYFAIEKEMGNLVITVISMSKDLTSFLMVYIMSIFGFGVALRGLFQHDYLSPTYSGNDDASEGATSLTSGYSTNTATVVGLLEATLGNYDLSLIDTASPYHTLGLIIMVIYLVLTCIILLNLLIAKMSSTYAAREEKALQEFEYQRAQIVKDFALVGEQSPLCMLPAPLNLLTTAIYPIHWGIINNTMFNRVSFILGSTKMKDRQDPKLSVISLGGTVADYVLGALSGLVMCKLEIFYDLSKLVSDFSHQWKLDHSKAMNKYIIEMDGDHSYTSEQGGGGRFGEVMVLNVVWTISMTFHVCLYLMLAPFFWVYYLYHHVKEVLAHVVKVEFVDPNRDSLRIVYEVRTHKSSGLLHKPNDRISTDVMDGKIIRGQLERKGKPFNASAHVVVRILCDPFHNQTGVATTDYPVPERIIEEVASSESTSTKSNSGEAKTSMKYKQKHVSYEKAQITMPLFPYNEGAEGNGMKDPLDRVMNEKLTFQIVELDGLVDGGFVLAEGCLEGEELKRHILNGRYEDQIIMKPPTGWEDTVEEQTRESLGTTTGTLNVALYFRFHSFKETLKLCLNRGKNSQSPDKKDTFNNKAGSKWFGAAKIHSVGGSEDEILFDDKSRRFNVGWSQLMKPKNLFTGEEKESMFEVITMINMSEDDARFESVKEAIKAETGDAVDSLKKAIDEQTRIIQSVQNENKTLNKAVLGHISTKK
jgi:ankyrin repeat protein